MSRDIHGNLSINNGTLTIQGDQNFVIGGDRKIYVGTNSSGSGNALTLLSGDSGKVVGIGGDLFLNAGDSTSGTGAGVGGEVFISGGESAQEFHFNSVRIGGDKTATASKYTLNIDSNSTSSGSVGIRTSLPKTHLHVVGQAGTTPTISSGVLAVFQNNISSSTESAISIIGGTAGASSVYFGNNSSESSGEIVYDQTTASMIFRTNGSSSTNIYFNSSHVLHTKGQVYNMTVSTGVVNLDNNSHVIISSWNPGSTSNTEILMVASPNDGQHIIIRTLSISNGNIILDGSGKNMIRIGGSSVSTITLSQHSVYVMVYRSVSGVWYEL